MAGARSPIADAILRPHERDAQAHPSLARAADLDAVEVRVDALEAVSGSAPATTTALGLVRMAAHGETAGGAVAVQADDPRLVLPLSTSAPLPLGAAAAGSSVQAARGDHVHPLPTPGDILGVYSPAGGAALDIDNGTLCWDCDKDPIEQMVGLLP
jgi:hypothetical protein